MDYTNKKTIKEIQLNNNECTCACHKLFIKYFYILRVNRKVKKVVFVFKQYAVRNAKINLYAVGKKRGVLPLAML